jgi:hypothetical protein
MLTQAQEEAERVGVQVTPQNYIRELLGSNLDRDTDYAE